MEANKLGDLLILSVTLIVITWAVFTANINKMYDLEMLRTAGETDTVHQYAETIALDALDLHLDPNLASKGILYIPAANRQAAENYFKNVTQSIYREGGSGRATIINEFVNFKLFEGTYSETVNSDSGYEVLVRSQTDAQRPYISCEIRGTAKRSTSKDNAEGAMRKTDFKIDLFAYASHIEVK